MNHAVVDASVAIKWFVQEEDTAIEEAFLSGNITFHAPDFLKLEVGNAIWKHALRGHVRGELFHTVAPELQRSINQWHPSSVLVNEAYDLARTLEHPIYDCIYLALAARLSATLVSADRRLATKLKGTPLAARMVELSNWRAAFSP